MIGQVGGLVLLVAAITLMYRPFAGKNVPRLVGGCVSAVLVFAAIFVWYPEVLPFFGLGWLFYVALLARRSKKEVIKVVLPAVVVGALVLIALNKYVIAALAFMFAQATGGMQSAELSTVLFPYFLVPSGIAALWGLIPIAADIHEPYLSLYCRRTGSFLLAGA